MSKAVDVIGDGLESNNERIRITAAFNTLKIVGIYGKNLEITGSTDIDEIEQQRKRYEELKFLSSLH